MLVGGSDESPSLVEAVALIPAAQGEDGLGAVRAPAHAAELEALGDQGFAGGFDDAAADHEALSLPFGVAHALLVFAEVGQNLGNALEVGVFSTEINERLDNGFGAVVLGQQALAQELELVPRRERPVAVNRGDGGSQVLGRVEEVEDFGSFGERREVLPVVAASVGNLDEPELGMLSEDVG